MNRRNKPTKAEQQEALENLRNLLPAGSIVWTVLRSVSKSGMSRRIDVYSFKCEGERIVKYWLTYQVATALGYSRHGVDGGVRVSGCGMDMGFHLVHSLSYALHGHEDLSASCRAGYTLEHEWI